MTPYWLEEDAAPTASRRYPGAVDVAVVGAGVTGCSAALALAGRGLTVRVYEARSIAEGASGRNGGFALRGVAAHYAVLRERHGTERTRELWRWTERALDRIAELGGDALDRCGSLRLAGAPREQQEVRQEYEALRADGLAAGWRASLSTPAGEFPGALEHPGDGSLQPARFVRRLAALAAEAGAELREHERVEDVRALPAERVLVCTDGYGRGLSRELDGAIWPVRGQVVVSEPLARRLYEQPHYARDGFDYWQQLPDRRLLLGGFRDLAMLRELTDREQTTPRIQRSLERFLGRLAGDERPRITHRWAGIFGLTEDLLPLVGPVPGEERLWFAAGYSGHGNVLGFACGELAAAALTGTGDADLLGLFDPARFAGRRPRTALAVALKLGWQRRRGRAGA